MVKFRFLRDHPHVIKFIKHMMSQRNINAEGLGKALGIYPYAIRNYLNKASPSLKDGDILRICEYLGIELELNVKFKSDY